MAKKKKSTNRKNITILKSEYREWEKMKGTHTWTSLMRSVREKVTYLESFFKNVKMNLNVAPSFASHLFEQGACTSRADRVHPKTPKRSVPTARPSPNKDRFALLNEIKSLGIEDGKFRKFLKPMSEEELQNIQLSPATLGKAQEKNECEGQKLKNTYLENQEKKIKMSDLKPPSSLSTST